MVRDMVEICCAHTVAYTAGSPDTANVSSALDSLKRRAFMFGATN